MGLQRWILHETPSRRYPIYTRSNAAEVMGAPVSPLGWSYVWRGAFGPGTLKGYIDFGGFDPNEFDGPEDAYAVFGGYFYLNLSVMLTEMERMAEGGAERLAAMFDSGPGMPLHVTQSWHDSPRHSAQLSDVIGRLLAGEALPDLNRLHDESLSLRLDRPDLASSTSADLVARMRSIAPLIERAGCIHVQIGQIGMIAHAQLAQALAAIGRSDDLARIGTGIGDVESADIACQLWTISRLVRSSPALAEHFARGLDGLLERIADPEFERLFDRFLHAHGCRASNEWDLIYDTFEIEPTLALALIETMARQSDDADPVAALERNRKLRRECLAKIREEHPAGAPAVDFAANALATWFAARERSKNMCVRLVHEARMCCEALIARGIAAATLEAPKHFYMLLAGELEEWAADPARFRETLSWRYRDYGEIAKLEPPFFVDGACPPLGEWPVRAPAADEQADQGSTLTGTACSPGTVTGRARVILDPSDPGALEPDEILVTTITNPSWTPLFLVAGAVVTEYGLFNSHASIVSRELGIPCVASVEGATGRIRDGALVRVDGSAGTVEILEVA